MQNGFYVNVMFVDLEDCDGFFRNLPGYPYYFAISEKYRGNLDFILDAVIVLAEAEKTLNPRQKCHEQLFYLVNGNVYKTEDGTIKSPAPYFPFKKIDPLAEFCRN